MNWKKVKLGQVLIESKIESRNPDPDKRITVRLNIKGVEKRPFEAGIEGGTKYYIRKAGQFIYGKLNLFKGAFGIVPSELDGFESSQDIPAFDLSKDCLAEWIMYYLKQGEFYKTLESISTGTGSRRIQPAKLFEIEMPLPPLEVQKQIINKIQNKEQQFSFLYDELDKQHIYIHLLRQSIIQEAVQGNLTKPDQKDEPATELLKRIKSEKEKLIEEGKLKKGKELSPIKEDEIPFKLPKGWVWSRLGDILDLRSGVTLGKSYKEELFEVPYLRVANVQRGFINIRDIKTIKVPKHEVLKYNLTKGDICMIEGGDWDKVGRCAIWQFDINPCIHQNHIFRLRFFKGISNIWGELYLNGPIARRYFESCSKQTTNLASINKTQLSNLIFPIPPLREQHRITNKIQQLKEKLDQLENQVQQSEHYAQKLLQSVFIEAFSQRKNCSEIEQNVLNFVAEGDE